MGERDIERALTELSENERTGVRSSFPENGKERRVRVQLSVRSHGGRRGCLSRRTLL
jgi:hypothetical protein